MFFRSALLRLTVRVFVRLTACLLALGFGWDKANALLADSPARDAAYQELAPADPPGERGPGQSGHAQHACHCGHGHVGWLQPLPSVAMALSASHAPPIARGDHAPVNRSGEPPFRPPSA